MNYTALKAEILANTDCQPYIVTNDMPKDVNYAAKDQTIADIFNAPVGTRLVERFENAIGIMSALGVTTGATLLEKLDTANAIITDSNDVTIISGLTVGLSASDITLDSLSITTGQTVTLNSATITHAA